MRLPAVLLAAAFTLTACSGGSAAKPAPTPTIAGLRSYPGLSHQHLGKGQFPQAYPQSPPVGGKHAQVWLKCVVYTVELPKENAVHSEEHGGVWLTYQPTLAADQVAKLALLHQTNTGS